MKYTYKITYEDGSFYNMDVAPNIPEQDVKQYMVGTYHVDENPETGEEIRRKIVSCENITQLNKGEQNVIL